MSGIGGIFAITANTNKPGGLMTDGLSGMKSLERVKGIEPSS
jgi:hypothetical protein